MLTRRMLLASALALIGSQSWKANADNYPSRPVRLVVPYPPGGAADGLARLIGVALAEEMGQPWVVENRPGAGANIGTQAVVSARADGYTALLVSAGSVTINPSLYRHLQFDPIKDLQPVSVVASDVLILAASNSFPARSVADVIAMAKSKPGQFNYASGGIGSGGNLAMELFKVLSGTDIVHVQYKGAGNAVMAAISGEVQLMISSAATIMPHAAAGRLRAIAVASENRAPALPQLPTVAESLPGYDVPGWYGLLFPVKTPSLIVAKVSERLASILGAPEVSRKIAALGLTPQYAPPEQLGLLIRSDTEKWRKVVKQAHIQPQ